MTLDWNEEKNKILKKTRNVSFEDIELALLNGGLLEIVEHPNQKQYPHQKIMYIKIERIYFYNFY